MKRRCAWNAPQAIEQAVEGRGQRAELVAAVRARRAADVEHPAVDRIGLARHARERRQRPPAHQPAADRRQQQSGGHREQRASGGRSRARRRRRQRGPDHFRHRVRRRARARGPGPDAAIVECQRDAPAATWRSCASSSIGTAEARAPTHGAGRIEDRHAGAGHLELRQRVGDRLRHVEPFVELVVEPVAHGDQRVGEAAVDPIQAQPRVRRRPARPPSPRA